MIKALTLAMLLALAPVTAQAQLFSDIPPPFGPIKETDQVRNAYDHVVLIKAEVKKPDGKDGFALGTGIAYRDHYIITNSHVVADGKATKIQVQGSRSDKFWDAKLVGFDKTADIAVLSVDDTDFFTRNVLNNASLGSAFYLKVGSPVMVVGHPWGLEWSVSKGIVSGTRRKIVPGSPIWFIQTDAHVFSGNSGGPMFDEKGNVVGINAIMLANSGGSYGFSIPIELARKVADGLIDNTPATWPVVGIQLKTADDGNVSIEDFSGSSDAGKDAGLLKGDEIVQLSYLCIKGASYICRENIDRIADLPTSLSRFNKGDEVVLKIKRDGEYKEINVVLDGKPSDYFKPSMEDDDLPVPAPMPTPPTPKKKK